jgi:C4-dicarboxylate-specific signal transduction histidine kinase
VSILASLRTFSRMDEGEMKGFHIHDGIDDTLMILEYRLQNKSHQYVLTYCSLPKITVMVGKS